MQRNKQDKKISAWKKRIPGTKVRRCVASGAFYSPWRGEWMPSWFCKNKTEWICRVMKCANVYHTRGKLVSMMTHTWSDDPLGKREFSRALREQGKKEVREQYQQMLEEQILQDKEDRDTLLELFEQEEEDRMDLALMREDDLYGAALDRYLDRYVAERDLLNVARFVRP